MTLSQEVDQAVATIRADLPTEAAPTVGLILGSGLGSFADRLKAGAQLPFDKIPGFPRPTIVGHSGRLVYGKVGALQVLAMQGRVHYYEGHDLARVAFPARVLVRAGCNTLIITNAAGGVDPRMKPGEIVLIKDHINLLGGSPLRGPNDEALGPRFPDMSQVYDPALRKMAARAAQAAGLTLREGVYAALAGPAYETPAEIRMVRTLGGDLVGMSTVPEATAAAHMGARVLGLSCVTNQAAGITGNKLSHDEVTETANRVRAQFEGLLTELLLLLAKEGK